MKRSLEDRVEELERRWLQSHNRLLAAEVMIKGFYASWLATVDNPGWRFEMMGQHIHQGMEEAKLDEEIRHYAYNLLNGLRSLTKTPGVGPASRPRQRKPGRES